MCVELNTLILRHVCTCHYVLCVYNLETRYFNFISENKDLHPGLCISYVIIPVIYSLDINVFIHL